ncbi:MAG: GIY-YIG nuclease superfamily protein [Spirochaetes bacterium ADurb.Bin218]|jgi:putative endonuclease|nr:MAG: GIY-YIG nuclease superfamily protein [Spirochaetes bacterium ADurb.Bin218]HOQ13045.1 GIY-YIG nuclease family protein [Spirochaetota bacterium]HOV09733.1 GIY-YIG nuclease family protein [Spirochaetota bacterium]HPX91447.1 GIY-YIG nuclease family protein [Spirochaetota bacterium]
MEQRFYIYIIKCSGNRLYTGITAFPAKRFDQHKQGKGAKWTRGFRPISLEALWEVESRSHALKVECLIKKLTRGKKIQLIANPFTLQEIVSTRYEDIFISVSQFKNIDSFL